MKRLSIKYALCSTLGLLTILFSVPSCLNPKEFVNPELTTVQVSSLTLSSKANGDLSKVFFSIDHANGRIYNAQLLPFGTTIDSVQITVGIQTTATLKILFEGKELVRSAADSISLKESWGKGFTLEVSNESKGLKKSYTVEVRSYPQDPDTYAWNPIAQQLPDLTGMQTIYCHTDKDLYIFATKEDKTRLYHTTADALAWQEVMMTGLSGLPVYSATATPDGLLYALVGNSENASLALSENGGLQWSMANEVKNGSILLGGFTAPGEKASTLCLIEKSESGKNFFACLTPKRGYKRGAEVPLDFPREGISTALGESVHHPLLILIGAKDSSGKPSQKTWTTTTGLDWLSPAIKKEYILPAFEGAKSPLLMIAREEKNTLYCIYPASTSPQRDAQIYSSKDLGSTWTAHKANLMLPDAEQPFGRYQQLFGFTRNGLIFYLFGGQKVDGSQDRAIWEGKSYILN